jgi:hypothetical protein
MNEPIIKEPIFVSVETHAYRKYVEQAKTYTKPLPFKKWLDEILNVRFSC